MLIGQNNGQMKFEDDPRHVIRVGTNPGGSGALTLAWVINPDYTVTTVTIDDTDYMYRNYKAVVDATEEDLRRVEERKAILRIDTDWIEEGDIVKIVGGKKLVGELVKVYTKYDIEDRYGHVHATYISTSGGKFKIENAIVHTPNIWVVN